MAKKDNTPDDRTLTTRQGHPVYDNQNQRTVGSRGPATLENYHFLEKISHFDRERIPERVVHARGATAFGVLRGRRQGRRRADLASTPAPSSSRSRASSTDVAIRFSTVIGGRDSSEAARDPRGFAVKFYTEDGNWDLVGNNLGGLLHPRRDQVPGLHPLAEARPGHLRAPGAQPHLRLHVARRPSRCT